MARETKSRLERLRVAAETKGQPSPSTFTMDFYRSTCERGGLATALIPLLKMAQERMNQPSLFPPLPANGVAGFSPSFRQADGCGIIFFGSGAYIGTGTFHIILEPTPCRKLDVKVHCSVGL
jgi:hypothetical protein